MNKTFSLTAMALTAAVAATALAPAAFAYSDKVEASCTDDYFKYCSSHEAGSTAMRRCMEANGKSLSRKCINALVDSGEVPRKFKR